MCSVGAALLLIMLSELSSRRCGKTMVLRWQPCTRAPTGARLFFSSPVLRGTSLQKPSTRSSMRREGTEVSSTEQKEREKNRKDKKQFSPRLQEASRFRQDSWTVLGLPVFSFSFYTVGGISSRSRTADWWKYTEGIEKGHLSHGAAVRECTRCLNTNCPGEYE